MKQDKKLIFKQKLQTMGRQRQLYILFLFPLLYYIIFSYVPMYGVIIAFKDYWPGMVISEAPWIGFEHFRRFFSSFEFKRLLKNTLSISFYSLIVGTIMPILLAISLNEMQSLKFKKFSQTITYAPHFISLVVMSGMIISFTSPTTGIVNILLGKLGIEPIDFMGKASYFKHIYVWTNVWQNTGWNSIIYIAALTAIDQSVYDAAKIDGCSKLQKIWYIDLPGILPTIITLLIMNLGRIMNVGFQKILLLQNPLNMPSSSVIQTYVYQTGLLGGQYGYSAAIGLFNNLINLVLIVTCNALSKKINNVGLW